MTHPRRSGERTGRRRAFGPVLVLALALALAQAPGARAAPAYWVDNEWIRVTAEELRRESGGTLLALTAECKKQGLPELIVTHLDANGTPLAVEKSGKYCPAADVEITFLLPLPSSGEWRIAFKATEGAM